MENNKDKGSTLTANPEMTILEFWESEKIRGIPNENFPLVITTTIANFDVSKILVNGGSSCGIMYSDLFENIGLKRGKLYPYEGSGLQAFNYTITLPYIKLMVTLGERRDTYNIDS